MTIHNPKTVRAALKARGNLEGIQFARIYQYRSASGGEVQFALFEDDRLDDMNGNQYVRNPVLLFDNPELKDAGKAFLKEGETPSDGSDAEQVLEFLNELRKEEGSAVTIPCDNPDFNGMPNVYVDVSSDWTDFMEIRFFGDSLVEALKKAAKAKEKKRGIAR